MLAHVNTKVKAWVEKKRPAIEEIEREYQKIVALQPAPPRWVIAAQSRVGAMWGTFVTQFRASPMPREWQGNGLVPGTSDLTYEELRHEYQAKLVEASAPQEERAKAAFSTCVAYSVKFHVDDEYARTCREWLAKNE